MAFSEPGIRQALTGQARFRVRLVVKRKDLSDVVEETVLIVDPTLHPGWPRSVGKKTWGDNGKGFSLSYCLHLIAADIDKDGQMEIPIAYAMRSRYSEVMGLWRRAGLKK